MANKRPIGSAAKLAGIRNTVIRQMEKNMQGLATAQRQYDRRLPVEIETAETFGNAMDALREDLRDDREALDIVGQLNELLQDDESDVSVTRLVANGHLLQALEILQAKVLAVANKRFNAAE